jgi:hypothetical protein
MRSLSSYRRNCGDRGTSFDVGLFAKFSHGSAVTPAAKRSTAAGSVASRDSIQLTMIDNNTATTTVFISNPRTLCTLTTRRMELLRTVVSVTPNVAEQPIAK